MTTVLNNPWVVGIGGGIVSGLFVYLLTNLVVNKVSKKEYYNKVKEANREIIVLLIMSVSEERIPSLSVIKSLLKSLARSYGIKEVDVNGIQETLEDLIKEIFETRFISNDKKIELSESLIKLINEHEKTGYKEEVTSRSLNMSVTYVYALTISIVIMSVITSILVIIDPIITNTDSLVYTDRLILPFAVGVMIALSLSIASSLRRMRNLKKKDESDFKDSIKEHIKK